MERLENIKIGTNNIDLLVITFVKSTVASLIHRSQVGIKYNLNNFTISCIINVYINNRRGVLLKPWIQRHKRRLNCFVTCSIKDRQPTETDFEKNCTKMERVQPILLHTFE